MNKALTPYVKGGGAGKYEEELKKIYGMDGSFKVCVRCLPPLSFSHSSLVSAFLFSLLVSLPTS